MGFFNRNTGASYGGYMINWINGHTDSFFKCLVCHDGMFNTLASYYATEELFFPEWEFKGARPTTTIITAQLHMNMLS